MVFQFRNDDFTQDRPISFLLNLQFQDCPLHIFRSSILDLFRRSYAPWLQITNEKSKIISIDYITIVPNLGINLRIMFSENVMDDDLWFELFMIVKI